MSREIQRTRWLAHILLILTAHGLAASLASALQDEFIKVASKVSKAVVNVVSTRTVVSSRPWFFEDDFFCTFFPEFCQKAPDRKRQETGLGSGVIIDEEGHVLTNDHVVSEGERFKITLANGKTFEAKLVGGDPLSDIAVLSLIDPKGKLPVAELGDSDKVQVGQWVMAIGNPFGGVFLENGSQAQPTVTVGVISALHRSITIQGNRYDDLIQTDASINPGNSGGPLVDLQGKVVGINTAILSTSGGNIGIGFAIPINKAKAVLASLIREGKVTYGFLGVVLRRVDEEIQKKFGTRDKEGAFITQVEPNSPADEAGLQPGDIIQKYNGIKVKNVNHLIDLVRGTRPGEKVEIIIWRNGKQHKVKATIAERAAWLAGESYRFRGMKLSDITPVVQRKFNLQEKEGVVVVEVEKGSFAARSGIQPGDVIYRIDNKKVTNLRDFKAYAEKQKDETVYLFLQKGNHKKLITLPPE